MKPVWAVLTHIFKDQVNVFVILCSDHAEEFDNIGVISKLLSEAETHTHAYTQCETARNGVKVV